MQYKIKEKYLPGKYKVVADLLREGKDKAITSTDIMKLSGINNKRDVMEIIEQLINRFGYCIGTSRKGKQGYYLIVNRDELVTTVRTYNAQAQSMLNRLRNLQTNYENRDQLDMEL